MDCSGTRFRGGQRCHSLAFCQAVEAASQCEIPERARYLRIILAELERLYNHLHYFGHLCNTTTLKVGEAQGKLLEEQCKQLNGVFTGSRFLRGLLRPGGLRRDLDLRALPVRLRALEPQIGDYMAPWKRPTAISTGLSRPVIWPGKPHSTREQVGQSSELPGFSGICGMIIHTLRMIDSP